MADQNHTSIRGERALGKGDADGLGFKEIASRVAKSLVDHASSAGFVIGVNGAWGSGKSSLLYLISDELGKINELERPTTISFSPWLVGNRDALLASLFGQLAEAISKVQLARGDSTGETKRKVKETAEKMRKFAAAASRTGELLEALSIFAGFLGPVGKMVTGLGKAAEKKDDVLLVKLKGELQETLRELNHRFIITVDDVDRLEPREVIEVLRLVRSVADFPNVIYLLCYDGDILAESIKRGADVPDGAAFLEKIVQLTVMVPRPEAFQLRQWFEAEIPDIVQQPLDDVATRLRSVISYEGGRQLHTPRAVVRTLDSLRFFWPALRDEKIDLPDLIWLLLIKDGAPKLYRWIENYLTTVSAVSLGIASVGQSAPQKELKALREAMGEDAEIEDLMYRNFLSEQLPGVEVDFAKDGELLKIFENVSSHAQAVAIRDRRLASPDHYRLYLALIGPQHAITKYQADEFWQAVDAGPDQTAAALELLGDDSIVPEMTKADLLLERLAETGGATIPAARAESLLLAFSDIMDRLDKHGTDYSFMLRTVWDRAERLVRPLLDNAGADRRADIIARMFGEGEALGWLTSIFRSETFAHGRFGDRRTSSSSWILTDEEYDHVASLLIERYRALSFSDLRAQSRPMNMLFAWSQGGDKEGPRKLLEDRAETDEGFIAVMELFLSVGESSGAGRYEYISRDNLASFLDYEAARSRLEGMKQEGLTSDLGSRRRRLVRAITHDRKYDE